MCGLSHAKFITTHVVRLRFAAASGAPLDATPCLASTERGRYVASL